MHPLSSFRICICALFLMAVVGNILVGCSDDMPAHPPLTLNYVIRYSDKSSKVTLIRTERAPNRYEDIYIDSLPNGETRRSDTYSFIIREDSLFMVNMTWARDRMYDRIPKEDTRISLGYRGDSLVEMRIPLARDSNNDLLPAVENLYQPIFIPTHFTRSNWDGDPIDDRFYNYFLLQDHNRSRFSSHMDFEISDSNRIHYYETAPVHSRNRIYPTSRKGSRPSDSPIKKMKLEEIMLDNSITRFITDVGGCERITNFTFQGLQFDTVLRCEHKLHGCMYVCSKFTQYYTTNYLLIVDSTCNKNTIQPTPESLARIYAISKRR